MVKRKKPKIKSWSELLLKSLKNYKRNSFILIPALIPVIFFIFLETFAEFTNLFLILFVTMLFIGIYVKAGMLGIVRESLNKTSSLKTFFNTANKKFPSLLAADLIVGGILLILISLVAIPLVAKMYYGMDGLLLIISVISLIISVTICLFLSFTSYAVVLSDLKAIQGIKESIKFVRRNFIKVILFYIIVFVLIIPVISLLGLINLYTSQITKIFLTNLIVWLITPYFMFLQGYFYLSKR